MPPAVSTASPSVSIMGIRGLPAAHGGFETFAAQLAPFLVERGWKVTVYCHEEEPGHLPETEWEGVRRVHLYAGADTAANSIRFDWACVSHAVTDRPDVVLTLGYNTASFGLRLRLAGIPNVINMDGIEWSRDKWGPLAKAWLYLNDRAGCLLGNHLVADHTEIARLLAQRVSRSKITTIPYGTELIGEADPAPLAALGVQPGGYATLIARAEPENSVLEAVQAFSARRRGVKLVVLGNYEPSKVAYHAKVKAAASEEVIFPGAIYDPSVVQALRVHALLYIHGHRVGGTNPSLLEAMGAGNAILAHDNRFNRGVAAGGARYFADATACDDQLSTLLADPAERQRLAALNRQRAASAYHWPNVLTHYESTLLAACRSGRVSGASTVDTRLDLDRT
jgi:glycosyltransferase involved in cell wall biosynthesis